MKTQLIQTDQLLLKKGLTVAVAESCSAGALSELLTTIPGSSKYFILGIITYSNNAKESILKIPHSLISRKGAVSKEVASGMAKSIRKIAKSDLGIGVTGIAGPSGATTDKPKGTVFIAVESKSKKICKKFHFTGSRMQVRKKSSLKAVELLKNILTNFKN